MYIYIYIYIFYVYVYMYIHRYSTLKSKNSFDLTLFIRFILNWLSGAPVGIVAIFYPFYVYIYIYIYVFMYIYIYIYIHIVVNNTSSSSSNNNDNDNANNNVCVLIQIMLMVAIFYPFSQFCEISISPLSLRKQPNTAPNLFQRGGRIWQV